MHSNHLRAVIAANLLALACSTSAFAQTAPAAVTTAADNAAPASNGLQDIVVTARRREESLQNVPITITALTGEQLERQSLRSTEDLRTSVPGLNIGGQRRDDGQFYIRGQGPGLTTTGQRNFTSVATYFAEVPTAVAGPGVFYDLSSVQVLKGPQGTLFGRNTTGGAVLFEPNRPTWNNNGYAQVTYGNYDYKQFDGVLNVAPNPDLIAIRLAAQISRRDGFTRSVITNQRLDGRDYDALRASVLLTPGAGIENLTIFDYRSKDNSGGSAILRAINPNFPLSSGLPPTALTPAQRQAILDQQIALGPRHSLTPVLLRSKQLDYGITNKTTFEVADNITLKNIIAYRVSNKNEAADYDGSPLNTLYNRYVTEQPWGLGSEQLTEEFQIQGKLPSLNLEYIVGFYHEDQKPGFLQEVPGNTLGSASIRLFSNHDKSDAVFGHVEWNPVEFFGFSGGVRQTWDDRKASLNIVLPDAQGFPDLTTCAQKDAAGNPQCPADYAGKFNALTYDATINLKPFRGTLVYGSFRHGYKSGGFNIPAVAGQELYPPEKVDSYEIGIKSDINIGFPIRFDGALFYDKYKNIAAVQVTTILPGPPPLSVSTVPGGVKAVNKGFEASLTVVPVRALSLSGFVSYLKSGSEDGLAPGTPTEDNPNPPPVLVPHCDGPTCLLMDGRQFPYQPKWKYGISGTLTPPIPQDYGELSLSADYSWQGKVFNNYSTPTSPATVPTWPSYGLFNARVSWNKIMDSRFDLSVFATNVTNKTYIIGGYPIPQLGFDSVVYGEPRMYGASLRVNFGER